MLSEFAYEIYSLGESAVTLDFGNVIDERLNKKVLSINQWLLKNPIPGICDIVTAYSSISVLYDPFAVIKYCTARSTPYNFICSLLEKALQHSADSVETDQQVMNVPVCYDRSFAPDLHFVSQTTAINEEELIRLHTSKVFYVFMIGFIPGFAYMGELDPAMQVARKDRPVPVAAGGVGIAGAQTGIYPLDSPGGWQIIGRTPLRLFNPSDPNPCLFRPGQSISFYPITKKEFESWPSQS